MKQIIFFLCLSLVCPAFSEPFTDIVSGLTFDIPPGYAFNEVESQIDARQNNWWYTFHDAEQNVLTVEIEEYDTTPSLPEHFHAALTTAEDRESVMYEGMEFRHFEVNGLPVTKWKLRVLALSDTQIEPLYFCDYLFVQDCFGFSINLIKKETSPLSQEETDQMMLSLVESIRFK